MSQLKPVPCFRTRVNDYIQILNSGFDESNICQIEILAQSLLRAWKQGASVFVIGNGGSAANAMHIANDFTYGIGACGDAPDIPGLRIEALPSNPAVLTCLGNDISYNDIFSRQLVTKGKKGDILLALSGSGNSENIVRALEVAKKLSMDSFCICAFTGGKCVPLSDHPIYFQVQDMQIAEDLQLIVAHICMQWLTSNKHISLGQN